MFEKVSWVLLILGAAYMGMALLSLVFPRLLINKKLAGELDAPRRKKYLLCQRINMFILGAVSVFNSGLPDHLAYPVGIPLLMAVLVSFAVCNKRTTGWCLPWV